MKMTKAAVFSLGLGVMSSLSYAQAPSIEAIDKRFAARDEGPNDDAKLANAVSVYQDYKVAGGPIIQMCRTALWGGGLLDGANVENKKDLLRACVKDSWEVAKHSKEQEPHYCYVACLSALGKIADDKEKKDMAWDLRLEKSTALKTTKMGDTLYGGREMGGILRIFAAVGCNPKARILLLYNPDEAFDFITKALNAEPDFYPPLSDEPISGEQFLGNYYYQAQAYLAVGLKHDDKTKLDGAIQSIIDGFKKVDDKTVVKGLEPEARRYRLLMQVLKGKIEKCKAVSDWDVCMQHELDTM
jgi:hypothetical protein